MAITRMPWRRIASRQTAGACGPSSLWPMASRPHGPLTSTSSHAAPATPSPSPARRARGRRTRALEAVLSQQGDHPLGGEPLADDERATSSSRRRRARPSANGPSRAQHGGEEARAPRPASSSARSPRPSSTRVRPSRRSHSSGPGVTVDAACRARSPAACSGRSRVAGCRRHTSRGHPPPHARPGRGEAASGARSGAAASRRRGSTRAARRRRRRPRRRRGARPGATWRRARRSSGATTPRRRSRRRAGSHAAGRGSRRPRSVRSSAGSPSSSNVGIATCGPLRTGLARALERLPHPPALAPVELQHEHVVVVEVQLEARAPPPATGRR